MGDSAKLTCFEDRLGMRVGMFWNSEGPRGRRLFAHSTSPSDVDTLSVDEPLHVRALWRFLSEHLDHDVRLLGGNSPEWESVSSEVYYGLRFIGRNEFADDPPLADYANGSWQPAQVWSDRPRTRPVSGRACLACFGDRLSLPLDFSAPPDMNRAVFRFLAEHVYHDVHLLGTPPAGHFVTVGAREPSLSEYADGSWPSR
ncbi:hypothetical protein [Hamadaea tsunoensis]|uniref:hypothetical protein n=1 Tax=Hamadaea tsunoensis TaxID=53368 RepID=UPI000426831B|nr:hypothetical protein [Hamadaea tsunoensis]